MNEQPTNQRVFEAQRVQEILGPHHNTVAECCHGAMAIWNEHARQMPDAHALLGPGVRGIYMHDLAVAHAKRLFAGTNVQNFSFRQVEFFDFGQGLLLRFKQPDCPDTPTAKGLANQLFLIPEIALADPDCQTIVVAEYALDPSGTHIARVSIACMVDSRKEWSYPVDSTADFCTKEPVISEDKAPRRKRRVQPIKKLGR